MVLPTSARVTTTSASLAVNLMTAGGGGGGGSGVHDEAERKYAGDQPRFNPPTSSHHRPLYDTDPRDTPSLAAAHSHPLSVDQSYYPSRSSPAPSPATPRSSEIVIEIGGDLPNIPSGAPLSTISSNDRSLRRSSQLQVSADHQRIAIPESRSEMERMLRQAELAAKAGNFQQLKNCDTALERYFSDFQQQFERPYSRSLINQHITERDPFEFFLLVGSLDLPKTKSSLFTLFFQREGRIIPCKSPNDDDEQITEATLLNMRKRISNFLDNNIAAQNHTFHELFFCFSKLPDRSIALEKTDLSTQLLMLIYLLMGSHPQHDIFIPDLFYSLAQEACEERLTKEHQLYFLKLSKGHPKIIPLVGSQSDCMILQVLDSATKQQININASCLLLRTGSDYVQTLFKEMSLSELKNKAGVVELNLTKTVFDRAAIEPFLQWLKNERHTYFIKPQEDPRMAFKRLSHIFYCFDGLFLKNQESFLERFQSDLSTIIADETLVDILTLAQKFRLTELIDSCIMYINAHPSGSVSIHSSKENQWVISRFAPSPMPAELSKAIGLLNGTELVILGTKPKTPAIEEVGGAEGDKKVTCLEKTIAKIKYAWNTSFCRALIKSTGWTGVFTGLEIAAKTTFPWWGNAAAGGLMGLLGQSCISHSIQKVVRKCLIPRSRRLRTCVNHTLPEAKYACRVRIHKCMSRMVCCPETPPSFEFLPRLYLNAPSPLPKLTHLDLSRTKFLTDQSFIELLTSYSQAQQLTLSEKSLLTEVGYAAINSLEHLTQLNIYIESGATEGPLEALDLTRILAQKPHVKIAITLSETTLQSLVTFLHRLPRANEVSVKLKHDIKHSPREYYSPAHYFPGILFRLIEQCSWITQLDCSEGKLMINPLAEIGLEVSSLEAFMELKYTNVLERLSEKYSSLKSLRIKPIGNASHILNGFTRLLQNCPQLTELDLYYPEMSPDFLELITQHQAFITLGLTSTSSLTREDLAKLAQMPFLRHLSLHSPLENIGDEGINLLLNRQPPLENLCIRHSAELSEKESMRLAIRSTEARSAHPISKLSAAQRNHYARLLLPFLFKFFGDNFHRSKGLAFIQLQQLSERLGCHSNSGLCIRSSQIDSLAKIRFQPLINRFYLYKAGYSSLSDILFETLVSELGTNPAQLTNTYWEFLEGAQPEAFCIRVKSLIELHLKILQEEMGKHLPTLELLAAWLNDKKADSSMIDRVFMILVDSRFAQSHFPLKDFVFSWIQAVKEEGDRCRWESEQRNLAFLGIILSNLAWVHRLLLPPKMAC